jgi:hypothetical protein
MKKSILFGILGLAFSAAASFGAGAIFMDNYNTYGPDVVYGPGGLGTPGTGLGVGWTAGLYFAPGDVRSSIIHDPIGSADPSTLGGGLTLGTGFGSTAAFYTTSGNTPGEFQAGADFTMNVNPGDTVTLMVVAYNGSSYATSLNRGHSEAFIMTTKDPSSPTAYKVGSFMPAFSVPAPEPATLALGGLGLASLLLFRRK